MELIEEAIKGKLSGKGRALLVAGGVLLLFTLLLPVWMVNLSAPQYPEGLRLWIYPTKITGDLNKINILNHYIGMKKIDAKEFPEFKWLPSFLVGMAILAFLTALIGRKTPLVPMILIFAAVGIFFLFRLDNWLYHYGHDLDPKAAMKIPPFKPPMLGKLRFANFTVFNYFHVGALTMVLAAVSFILALFDHKLFKRRG